MDREHQSKYYQMIFDYIGIQPRYDIEMDELVKETENGI